METLNRSRLAANAFNAPHTPGAPVNPVNILQIGDGNFLRAFADWMIDIANEKGVFKGGVAIAQPLPEGIATRLAAQDNLYTVLLRGVENGKPIASRRIVSCVSKALNPYSQWAEMKKLAADPALRFVISNTTEAGIADVEEPYVPDACPKSFPAKVASLLATRFAAVGANGPGLIFVPCELIEANGTNLRRIVTLHAQRWNLGAGFMEWLAHKNHFLDTLVDRVVSGYPGADAGKLRAEWKYDDPLVSAGEPFHFWVIQGPKALAEEFPLHKAGLDVVWTDDLKPYRTRKVRILNGAHTGTALAAYCAGLDTVQQMTEDPVVSAYLRHIMFQEIVPFVPLPEPERQSYAASIMERFANPFIRHELISIALNSVSKWKVRVLPTVKDFAAGRGSAPRGLSFSLAALLWFYRGKSEGNAFKGTREAGQYPIVDDAAVIATMARAWQSGDPAAAAALLADASLWGEDLTKVPGLAAQVGDDLAFIATNGMKAALARVPQAR
jgi:tagaturonate reductase